MSPHIFLFRFRNILVSHQAVSLTFYNKIAHMEANTCVRVHFLPSSKSNLKTEIEWQAKQRTTVSDLLPITLVLLKER